MYEAMVEPSNRAGVFGHGFTYSGHPVACAAALKAIEIYERDGLFAHAAEIGGYMQERLGEFIDHPLVGEVRGQGPDRGGRTRCRQVEPRTVPGRPGRRHRHAMLPGARPADSRRGRQFRSPSARR